MGAKKAKARNDKEVVGSRVSIKLQLDDGRESFFHGTVIKELQVLNPNSGTYETMHLVLFDDGDERVYDLAEREQIGHLKWIGRGRKLDKKNRSLKSPIKKSRPGAIMRKSKESVHYSPDEKEKIAIRRKAIKIAWVKKMYDWLTDGRVSERNADRVITKVEDLASGEGITYDGHWDEGVVFYGGKKVNLSYDFDKMRDEALRYEEGEDNEDLGHGWLMRHPINYLKKYQEYRRTHRS